MTEAAPTGDAATLSTKTIASAAQDWAKSAPTQVALRSKSFGIWVETTWQELWDQVEVVAHGLLALGVEPGDRVSIHGEGRQEWVVLDLAAVAVRAAVVGLSPGNSAEQTHRIVQDASPRIHLAEDQEQVDKIVDADASLFDGLERVLTVEKRGIATYTDERLLAWEELVAQGTKHRGDNPHSLSERMSSALASDPVTIVYETDDMRGVVLSNRSFEFFDRNVIGAADRVPGKQPSSSDQIMSYIPLSLLSERLFSTWTMVSAGPIINFAESSELAMNNLVEAQPTLMSAPPAVWAELYGNAQRRAAGASFFKRQALKAVFGLGKFISKARAANGGAHSGVSRLVNAIAFPTAFRSILASVGLRHVRYASTAGQPIDTEVSDFFRGLGVPLYENYGPAEAASIATSNMAGRQVAGSAGEAFPNVEVRVVNGDIEIKHGGIFAGYWNNPEATAAAMSDGWLRTGDSGSLDGKQLMVERTATQVAAVVMANGDDE